MSAAKGARLVECLKAAQQLVFCIFTFNEVEEGTPGSAQVFEIDQFNAFIE